MHFAVSKHEVDYLPNRLPRSLRIVECVIAVRSIGHIENVNRKVRVACVSGKFVYGLIETRHFVIPRSNDKHWHSSVEVSDRSPGVRC